MLLEKKGKRPRSNSTRISSSCWKRLQRSDPGVLQPQRTSIKVEMDLNEGLELVYDQFRETEVATRDLTCSTEARGHNKFTYLQDALDMISGLLRRESHEEHEVEGVEEQPDEKGAGEG